MRWLASLFAAITVFCASACGSKEARPAGEAPPATPPPHAAPSVDPMALCDEAMRFLRHASDCAPADLRPALSSNVANLEMIVRGITPETPKDGRETTGSLCAIGAYSFDRELAKRTDKTCAAALTDAERAHVRGFLEGYYARRTAPRPTGDRTLDDQLSALAAARDAMCACTELACVDRTQKLVDAAVTPIPRDKQTALDDGASIVDEVTRCSGRIEAGIPLPLP